ncbi:S26 family signal peptidase [Halogeometricum borinquense]|uniref:S26 family signal peptidase n=1 Tax=Halogeometricum borinquense TaxID=60847 RepID=A0A6C0UIV0_9EURY|nr:S26 family signal peptidase [Halogeometricum borinquense]QIB75365.1 S26 family signal peptidase [Halogeometricum borinquense]
MSWSMVLNLRVLAVLSILLSFSAGWIVSDMANPYTVTVQQPTASTDPQEYSCQPVINVTCPDLDRNVSALKTELAEQFSQEYRGSIQGAHNDVDWDMHGGEVTIEADIVSRIYGRSMQPTLFTGNRVVLVEYYGQDLSEGDIIRFENGDQHTIHRIRGDYELEGFVVTQGDANSGLEEVDLDRVTHVAHAIILD